MAAAPEDQDFQRFRREGSPESLGRVYDRCAGPLFRVALRLASSVAEAEDLLQDSFLVSIDRREHWDASRPLLPWLHGILTKVAARRRAARSRETDPDRLAERSAPTPDELATRREFSVALETAISQLGETYRPVMRLHLMHGMNAAEIAHVLDRPPGTVRTQVVRGLEQLRALLPKGIGAALLATFAHGRGLAAIRAELLSSVPAAAMAAVATTPLALLLGVTMKYVLSLAAVAAFVFLALETWPVSSAPELPTDDPGQVASPSGTATRSPGPGASDAPERERKGREPLDEEQHAPDRAALRIRVLGASEGGEVPVRAVGVTLLPALGVEDWLGRRTAVTGESGEVQFDDLAPGRYRLLLDRGVTRQIELVAGAQTRTLVLPVSPRVRGIVLDAAGRPVAGARIWISEGNSGTARTRGQWVTKSGPDGRFELARLPVLTFAVAWHDEHAPSCAVTIRGGSEDEVRDCTLRLRGPGAALRARILDEGGEPVAAAWCRLGGRLGFRDGDCPGIGVPPSLEVRSDAEGYVSLAGIPPGHFALLVRVPEHAPWFESVEFVPGRTSEVTVRLERGLVVEGRVFDELGRPLEGALVRCGGWSSRAHASVRTRGDGRFRLGGVASDPVRLQVVAQGYRDHEAVLRRRTEPVLRWSCRLERTRMLSGRLLDADGEPVRSARVQLAGEDGRKPSQAVGGDGRFHFSHLGTGAYELFYLRTEGEGAPEVPGFRRCDWLPPLHARTEEIVVRLPRQLPASGAVTGTFLDSDGAPIVGGRIQVFLCDSWGKTLLQWRAKATSDENGRFRVEPLHAGAYRFELRSAEDYYAPVSSRPVLLTAAGELDLGVLRRPALGRLAIRLEGAEAPGTLYCQLSDGDRVQHVLRLEGQGRELRLAPGRYRVTIYGGGFVHRTKEVQIQAERTASLSFALVKGVQRQLAWDFGSLLERERLGSCAVRLEHEGGDLVLEQELDFGTPHGGTWWPTLLPGRYAVRFDAKSLGALHGDFEIRTLRPRLQPVIVSLR